MHAEAYAWVAQYRSDASVTVLDLGGRNINGSPRALFPNAVIYTVLDIAGGSNVDIIADAATWIPDREYDVVVACEVFEHTRVWPDICMTALKACRPDGMFVATMAGPGRPPHSAVDGGWVLHPGEHYENVRPEQLRAVLTGCGFRDIVIDQQSQPADVRCVAYR